MPVIAALVAAALVLSSTCMWGGMDRVPIDENESGLSERGGQKCDSRSEESNCWASRPVEGMVESSIVEDSLIEGIETHPCRNPIHQGSPILGNHRRIRWLQSTHPHWDNPFQDR